MGPLRKAKESKQAAELQAIEQYGVRKGLVLAQAAEHALQEAVLDPIPEALRPWYVGDVAEISTVVGSDFKHSMSGSSQFARSIRNQRYRRSEKQGKSVQSYLESVGSAIIAAANRYSERLILVDGLAAAFLPAPSSVATRPSPSYRPGFARSNWSEVDSAAESEGQTAWDGTFGAAWMPLLPSEAGGVLLAGGSRGDHQILGNLLDGGIDMISEPTVNSWTSSALADSTPAEECMVVALAWTVVKMNADHLRTIGDALRVAAESRNGTQSSMCVIIRVFPGMKREEQLSLRSLAFDVAAGIGLSSIPGAKLEIVPGMDYVRYRAKLAESAFAIDSYPFSGCNSMHDLLYSGVPVVSMEGRPWRSRVGSALLRRAGLGYLVAQEVESFRSTVANLVINNRLRAQARAQLANVDLDAALAPTATEYTQWKKAFSVAMEASQHASDMQRNPPFAQEVQYSHFRVELAADLGSSS